MSDIWKQKILNGWWLFGVVSIPMTLSIIVEAMNTDLATGEGISHMIGFAVRWSIPFIFMAAAASSMNILFPSPFTKWWARNRKFIGLCFATGMAWQGFFIFVVSTAFKDYYYDQIYNFRDELEGTIGYVFLAGMIITSFAMGRKLVSPLQWKLIQKGGIYFLWAYPFSVYWWNVFYYPLQEPFNAPRLLDYVLYAAGFAAFAVRIAAWGKKRAQANARDKAVLGANPALKAGGMTLILIGLVGSATGRYWGYAASEFLAFEQIPVLSVMPNWLPFWPLEPFLPLLVMGVGTWMVTSTRPAAALQSA